MSNKQPTDSRIRHRLRFQFTLRGGFILFTTLAVATWFWWQRPFETEFVITNHANSAPPAHIDSWSELHVESDPFIFEADEPGNLNPADPFGGIARYYRKEKRTVHRGWSDVIRHGPTRVFNKGGQQIFVETWKEGSRNVPYQMWNASGQLIVTGQFLRDSKHGKWTMWTRDGRKLQEQVFDEGKPAGTWCQYTTTKPRGKKWKETHYENGKRVKESYYGNLHSGRSKATVGFDDDKIIRFDGKPIEEFYTNRFAEKGPSWIQELLDREWPADWVDVTLHEIVGRLCKLEHDDRLIAVKSNGIDSKRRCTIQFPGISWRIGILMILREYDLVCDYRYEQIVMTTRDDARTWRDRTGMDDLNPPANSPWARFLALRTGAEITQLSSGTDDDFQVKIWLDPRLGSAVPKGPQQMVIHHVGRPIREWLHLLLGRENLTCELDGNTLRIKPLE